MQVISGYESANDIKFRQRLRLYNLSRPAVKKHRMSRRTGIFKLDSVDQWVISTVSSKKICAVDCAGWYLQQFGFDVQCIESDDIAKIYNSNCCVEYDVLVHRPSYVDTDRPVLFRYPWFLKYCKLGDFVNFLNVWTQSTIILEFDPIYIQHNHLKFKLIELVKQQTQLEITAVKQTLWMINK